MLNDQGLVRRYIDDLPARYEEVHKREGRMLVAQPVAPPAPGTGRNWKSGWTARAENLAKKKSQKPLFEFSMVTRSQTYNSGLNAPELSV